MRLSFVLFTNVTFICICCVFVLYNV